MGNGSLVHAKSKGSIPIQLKLGPKFIRDVLLLVHDSKQNLLSDWHLLQNGYAVNFEVRGCEILDKTNRK